MPTAQQYRQAASRYAALGENLRRQAAEISGSDVDRMLGPGPVRRLVDEQLASIAYELSTSAMGMERLAGECLWRATVCDEYARTADVEPLSAPPYPWVAA